MFATREPAQGREHPLNEFAEYVVEGATADGITFLAGVRGSGKSTVLNHLVWFAENWLRGRSRLW